MKLAIHAVSDRGKVREHNEDMVLTGNIMFRDDSYAGVIELSKESPYLAAVADGMGGHLAGEVASGMAIHSIAKKTNSFEFTGRKKDIAARFTDWVKEIHDTIIRDGNGNPERTGMGTTLVGLFISKSRFYYFNAGDSRLYLQRGGRLSQLSRDHSLRELSGMPGIPANILANCIGAGSGVYIDFEEIKPAPASGDILLLCSDGLTDMVGDHEIESVLQNNPDEAAELLVERANSNGGVDNISVVTAQVS